MKYSFYQFLELACSLIDWIRDQVDPVSEDERIDAIKHCPTSVQRMHLERCLTLEYRVTPRH